MTNPSISHCFMPLYFYYIHIKLITISVGYVTSVENRIQDFLILAVLVFRYEFLRSHSKVVVE